MARRLAFWSSNRCCLSRRRLKGLIENVEALSALFKAIAGARKIRDQRRQELARWHRRRPETPLGDLIQLAPPDFRPLLGALIEEINHLLSRSQDRLLANNLLLRRAVTRELHQRLSGRERLHRPWEKRLRGPLGCQTSLARLFAVRRARSTTALALRKRIADRSETHLDLDQSAQTRV